MRTLMVVNGGDAPGINALIARYAALATANGDDVMGAQAGFAGVLHNEVYPLALRDVLPLVGLGGSVLTSTREPALAKNDADKMLRRALDEHAIDNVLFFGGNGTLKYISPLLRIWGIPAVGVPTTIDNDVAGTERTLGFDSACNYAYQAVEGALATARALPGRIFMVETLGGDTGYIALEVALGAGAHVALLPEYDYDDEWLADRLRSAVDRDGYALGVLSEGVPRIPQMGEVIPRLTGTRLRYIQLGHAQRGGQVTHTDRRLAMDMARIAYDGLRDGVAGTLVVRGGEVKLYTGDMSGFALVPPDHDLYAFVNGLA